MDYHLDSVVGMKKRDGERVFEPILHRVSILAFKYVVS